METRTIRSSTGGEIVFDLAAAGDQWVLLVHGLSSNAKTWWQVAEQLAAAGLSVITVDQRSHGRSPVSNDGYDWEVLAADLVRVLDAAGADRVLAAGQSWGASVVLETAVRHPERIRAVVSVDGAYVALRSMFPNWEMCQAALRPADIPPLSPGVMRGYISDAHPTWSDEGVDATLGNFRETNGFLERALPIPHHMQIVRSLWDHDPGPLYTALEQPSTIISASPSAEHITMAATEIIAVPGDHDLHVEQPDRIAELLIERSTRWGD